MLYKVEKRSSILNMKHYMSLSKSWRIKKDEAAKEDERTFINA